MIKQHLLQLREDIAETAKQCSRRPGDIKLVAVSKHFPISAIKEAYAAGQKLFGENYLQQAAQKRAELPPDIRFHLIGHLQSNKAKTAAEIFSMVETIDRFKIASALDRHMQNMQRTLDILVQVNIGHEPNKSGVLPEQAAALASQISGLKKLRIKGLMAIPPYHEDPEQSRPHFRNLRLLAEQLTKKGVFDSKEPIELSMGMSNDYRVAIEEGATIIRVGTAIFGERL